VVFAKLTGQKRLLKPELASEKLEMTDKYLFFKYDL
jgi:hypothetical protein